MSSSNLGKWVDKLFDDLFYQPDDEFALKTFEENISPGLQVRINGEPMPRDVWKAAVIDARAKNVLSIEKIQELFVVNSDGDVGVAGSVSHISTFALKDKQTGVKHEMTSLTVITTAWKDGKRVITDLTELMA